jgi:diguanylate cyclase (GGDEF)-like protein/PAS domain S-box-containing protein
MRSPIAQKLSLSFAAAVVILLATAAASYSNTRQLLAITDAAATAQEVLAGLDALTHSTAGTGAAPLASDSAHAAMVLLQRAAAGDTARARRVAALEAAIGQARAGREGGGAGARSAAAQLTAWRAVERNALRQHADAAHRRAARVESILQFGVILAVILAPLAYLIVRNDARVRLAAGRAVEESEARFRAATDGSMDAFYVLRALRDRSGELLDFEFVDLNARAEGLLGHPRHAVLGQRLCELIPANRSLGFVEKYRRVMETGMVLEEECEVISRDYSAAWIHHQVVPMPDGVAITSRDVTQRKRQEDALRALSLVDELTGLYNRRGFLTLAQQQLKLARRGQRELVLLFIDMDDFKEINDTFGHQEGDTALLRASEILKHTFRDSDILARLGGDEFVVLATDTGRTGSEVIVNRLRHELRVRNEREGYPYRLSFSVGAARFDPDAPPSIEELLAAADAMLYEQKKHKRATSPAVA